MYAPWQGKRAVSRFPAIFIIVIVITIILLIVIIVHGAIEGK